MRPARPARVAHEAHRLPRSFPFVRPPKHWSEAMLGTRKGSVADGGDVRAERFGDSGRSGHEIAHEARGFSRRDAERVIDYQHLSGAFRARTDADHGHAGGG